MHYDAERKELEKRLRNIQYQHEDARERMQDEIIQWRESYVACERHKDLLQKSLNEFTMYMSSVIEQ